MSYFVLCEKINKERKKPIQEGGTKGQETTKSHRQSLVGSMTESYSRNWQHIPARFYNCFSPVTAV